MLYTTANKEFTIAPGCPWYEQQQAYGPANVNWCEPTSCAYINEPANTWSNFGLIFVGLFIIYRLNQAKENVLRDFGLAIVANGILSFYYHATNNFYTQFLDFLGMFLATGIPMAIQTQRLRVRNPRNYHAVYWFYVMLSVSLFWSFNTWGLPVQLTVGIQIGTILILELWCKVKEGKQLEMKWFWISLVLIAVAQTFSQLDLKRIWCEPENHVLHGHAIWHVLSGLSLGALAVHFRKVLTQYKNS